MSKEAEAAFALTVPVPAPIAAILWDAERGPVSRRELADAVLEEVGWDTRGPIQPPFGPVESLAAARYLASLVDEVGYILEREHSVSVPSAAQTAARAALPHDLGDAAACIEEFGWQNARFDGAVGNGIRKVLEQGGARIAACLLRRLVDEGVVDELQSRDG